ncbi:MAG: hypothetical protein ACLFM0_01170 [Spirochaetales bacterium]
MKSPLPRFTIRAFTVLILIFGGLATASAQEENAGEALADPERFSLGIIVGRPTGLSAKAWLGEVVAVDAAAAWNFEQNRYHFHSDYLQHFFDVFDVAPDRAPMYIGVGGNFRVDGREPGDSAQFRSGARVPIGVSFLPDDLPLDAFAEAVPGIRLLPNTEFEFWAGIGARYRF